VEIMNFGRTMEGGVSCKCCCGCGCSCAGDLFTMGNALSEGASTFQSISVTHPEPIKE
jgi:hypothetical protein